MSESSLGPPEVMVRGRKTTKMIETRVILLLPGKMMTYCFSRVNSLQYGVTRKEIATETLIELWGEESIQIALDNAKTTKHSCAVYNSIWVSELLIYVC